jgi:hypothetical protein
VLNRAAEPSSIDPGAPRIRAVEHLVLHREPISFRELCQRAVPEETRYLILDLDRTVHLGRNMGELRKRPNSERRSAGRSSSTSRAKRRLRLTDR